MSDAPGGEVSEAEYLERVEERFRVLRGAPLLISPDDVQRVLTWFREGVPLFLVLDTLDELFRRAAAAKRRSGPRTLGYCELAVREAFDDWRDRQAGRRREGAALPSFASELFERAAAAVEGSHAPAEVKSDVAAAVRRLGEGAAARPGADHATALDHRLRDACVASLDAAARQALDEEARAELAPFAASMSAEVFARALDAAVARRVRARFALPDLTLLPLA